MHFSQIAFTAAALLSQSLAQTPQGFNPAAQANLGLTYAGNNVISPPGKQVLTTQVATQPALTAPAGLSASSQYIIAMVDIDVNMNGTGTTVLHWLQPNMQLNAQTNQLSVTGANTSAVANSTAAAYLSPGPPPGPPHRYVQVLFQQPTNFQFPACFVQATQQTGRLGFDINQFVSVAGLQAPVAGNFIQARATAAGPASTPLPTTSSVKSAAGCVATSGPSSARMVKRLEDVLW